jgi:hypothetical protein
MVGILAFGTYVPRLRLQRSAIVSAHNWFNPGLKGLGALRSLLFLGPWQDRRLPAAGLAGSGIPCGTAVELVCRDIFAPFEATKGPPSSSAMSWRAIRSAASRFEWR